MTVGAEDITAGLQVATVASQVPEGLHEVTTEVQTSTAAVQQEVSKSQQDNQDNADIVEDIEDKLEEVEDEQKSIREHVHRVTSWNEVVFRDIFRSFLLQILTVVNTLGVQSAGGFPAGNSYRAPCLSSLSICPLVLLQAFL